MFFWARVVMKVNGAALVRDVETRCIRGPSATIAGSATSCSLSHLRLELTHVKGRQIRAYLGGRREIEERFD
jgi:hypothetical protein